MNHFMQQLIDHIIIKKAFLNNYPKPGVVFLAIDALFNDSVSRKLISDAVIAATKDVPFDSIAGIASRGYLFSGMIANRFSDKGEYFIQKTKSRGDSHFVQIDTQTEYSSDSFQVLKNTIQKGKKYLLMDDLIATGGSVIAAIKLIRACGGEVNSVFAMTELLDFGAREKLKREGVELISLLKFTNQDLQKLLDIQERHEKNPTAPITYQLACHTKEEQELMQFNMRRLVDINSNKSKKKYAKKGVLFTAPTEAMLNPSIDLYNQGCPKTWNLDSKKMDRNNFKIFSTGDSFSVLSPDVEMTGTNVTIHIGLQHTNYSPLVLLHEALQLCRTVYEQGAESITVAIPEQFHPALHHNDFNLLLMRLFKISGVNNIYYYDKNYTGTLDEAHSEAMMPLTLSQQSDMEHYQISRKDLLDYLHFTKDLKIFDSSLDAEVMHFTRKSYLNKAWSKLDLDHTDMDKTLFGHRSPAEIKIPEIKTQAHVLLCCSANRPLAENIASSLRMRGEVVNLFQTQGKGELAAIPDEAKICGATVTIVQATRPSPDDMEAVKEYQKNGAASYFFETAMIARQARLRGADKVNLINSYQFGARSDKAENDSKGKTGAYVQQNGMLLEASGVSQVITAECHDAHTLSGSYTHKKIKSSAISALTIMSTQIVKDWMNHPHHGQLRLVTPDEGAAKRTKELTVQLQAILGKQLCESRILGEKQRDSHQDDSALINTLHSGSTGINANDKYLITDDETATGTTLCQAVMNLKKQGANDITVAVVHNNMPLDWLERQLCLARFLYLGVNDLHFSDTQEMGTLAKSYDDMIDTYSHALQLPKLEVEKQVFAWFKKNISKDFSDQNEAHITQEFTQFQSLFNQLGSRIIIHSLADAFAAKVMTRACTPHFYASDKGTLFFQHQPAQVKEEKRALEKDRTQVQGVKYES